MKYLLHAFNSSYIEILHQTHTPRRPHHLTGNMKYKKKFRLLKIVRATQPILQTLRQSSI